jgi:radical SAM protein with 4Fe4S-binding SPASM domain
MNGLGEPLLDKHLLTRIRYMRAKCPSLHISLHTNGVYFTDPQALRDAGLDEVWVSLNAVNAEQHEQVTGLKGKWSSVLSNIDRAMAVEGLQTNVRAVYNGDSFTPHDSAEFKRRWPDRHVVVYETNWNGYNRTINQPADPDAGCHRALVQVYITYNGDVHMCCMDPFGKIVFGNVRTQTIREVYNSERYVAFRLAHYTNRARTVRECNGCTRC